MRRIFTDLSRYPSLVSLAIFEIASIVVLLTTPDIGKFSFGYYLLSILVSLTAFLVIELVLSVTNRLARTVLAAILGFLLAVVLVGNIVLHKFFGQFLTQHMLNFVFSDPAYLTNYGRTYLWGLGGIGLLALSALFYWVWRSESSVAGKLGRKGWTISLISTVAAFMILANQTYHHKEYTFSMDGSSATAIRSFLLFRAYGHELASAQHERVAAVSPSHYNVLLVINESWGKKGMPVYGSADTAMPFLTNWLAREQESFVVYQHAFTNSSATNVSMPSLLTGVAPYESFRKLHRKPFVWDYAKAAGLRTGYVSAQRYAWANLTEFLFSSGPDFHRTAEQINAPIISDCGIDDLLAVRTLDTFISQRAHSHFFAVYNSNALHAPFQQTSECLAVQPSGKSRYNNAAFILDKTFELMYETLKTTGALDSTIIIFTADHGDCDELEHLPRITSYYDEVASIPFLIYLPASWRAEHPSATDGLRANASRNVMNLDITPTIATLTGAHTDELAGNSLTTAVDPNRACIALNTNEIRSWDHDGFGIYRGDTRFVYTDIEGPRYYRASRDPHQRRNEWSTISVEERQQTLRLIAETAMLSSIFKP